MAIKEIGTNKFSLFLVTFVVALSLTVWSPSKISAYDGARLIDNAIFRNSSSMSKSEIQAFLDSMNSGLRSRSYVLDCYGAGSTERAWYTAVGAPCDQSIPASHIIYYAARIYGINPQAVLATLQKEQSLITTTNPTSWQLDNAMGYGCPTEGSCSSTGFYYQIDHGVWVLRYHYERANGNNSWWNSNGWTCGTEKNFYKPHLYPNTNVSFYDQDNVAYRTYRLYSAATSALYCYTPHAYNNPNGLYGLPRFGTTGRYYTGSYNFVKFFKLWFGPVTQSGDGQVLSGDWDGDGDDTIGIKRGNLYLLDNDNDGIADIIFNYGLSSATPLVGNWDGVGGDTVALKVGDEYYINNGFDASPDARYFYGDGTETPLVGDWDGDGKDSLGLKAGKKIFISHDFDQNYNGTLVLSLKRYFYGDTSVDVPVVGDFDGNGIDSVGLKIGNKYFINNGHDGTTDILPGGQYRFIYNEPEDEPVVGNWDASPMGQVGRDTIGLKINSKVFINNNFDGTSESRLVIKD